MAALGLSDHVVKAVTTHVRYAAEHLKSWRYEPVRALMIRDMEDASKRSLGAAWLLLAWGKPFASAAASMSMYILRLGGLGFRV